jgi:chromosome segregation ATPase
MSAIEANSNQPEEPTFEQTLQTLEESVVKLKNRYSQVQQDQARQVELQSRKAEIANQPELKAELEKIETELSELEIRLESELFSWESWKQYFWQTVRFVGLGMAIGWGLAFYVMKHPVPGAIEPNRSEQVR